MQCLNKSLPIVQEALRLIPSEPAVAKIIASLPATATIDDVLVRYNEMVKEKQTFQYNNTFFSTKTGQEFSKELQARLLRFVKGLGIRVDFNADEVLNSREFRRNPLAAFDVLQKYMAFAAGQESLLPREVAAATLTFLGRKSTIYKALLKYVKEWEDYDKWYNHYNKLTRPDADTYYDEEEDSEDFMLEEDFNFFAHRMTVVKMLEESFVAIAKGAKPTEKTLNEDVDRDYFQKRGRLDVFSGSALSKVIKRAYNYLLDLFGQPLFKKYNRQTITDLALDVAEDVLKGDYKKFLRGVSEVDGKLYGKKGELLEMKTYNETLEKDAVARKMIDILISNPYIGFKMSGSLTLRRYGTLFRDIKENLHDIDGVIPLDVFQKDPLYQDFVKWIRARGLPLMMAGNQPQFQKEVTPKLQQLNWYVNLMREFPNFQLERVFIGKDHKKGESITIQGTIEKNGQEYKFDFFLRTQEGNYPEIFDNYWKDWKQIFEAKLNMGRSKDLSDLVYFEPFIQDKYKFTNKGFRYFVFAEDQTMAQLEDMDMSEANAATLEKVKEAAAKMGISIQDLNEYAKENNFDTTGVNGVADLVRKVIAIAKGREGVVLTEELVHIARAMLEQTNPGLVTEMISRIDKFKIYQRVLDVYSQDPRYLLPNGKPNIRKLKMEAVDKLIAEVIINKSEGSNMYPELMEVENRGMVKSWWQKLLDWLGIRYDKSGIDIYEEAAAVIMKGELRGEVSPEAAAEGVFLQRHVLSDEQSRIGNLLLETENLISREYEKQETDSVLVDSEEANNFYVKKTADNTFTNVRNRVTDRVKEWYNRVFGDKQFTEFQKMLNELKRQYGVKGHLDLQGIIRRYYNKNGTRKDVPDDIPEEINLPSMEMYEKLEQYFLDLIYDLNSNLSEGEVAVWAESIIYDGKVDEAGTIDLLIVEPMGRAHIFDWKFMQVKSDKDVAWFKQEAYNTQLGRYQGILTDSYGIKSFGKVRAVPILMDFSLVDPKDYQSERYLSSVVIGSVNPELLEDLRLIPVSVRTESTGYDEFDATIRGLNELLAETSKEEVSEEGDKEYKIERLNLLRRAIRHLQGTQNIAPLVDTITSITADGVGILERLEQWIQTPPNPEDEVNQELSELAYDARNFLQVASLFERIDDELGPLVYTESMENEAETEQEKEYLELKKANLIRLRLAAGSIRESKNKIEKASRQFADIHIGERNAVSGLESPEAIIKGLASYFRGAGEMEVSSIKILVRMVEEAEVKAQASSLQKIKRVIELAKRIKEKHGDEWQYIKKVFQFTENEEFMNKLIREFDKDFYTAVDALVDGTPEDNRAWLEENVDMDAYREEAAVKLEERLGDIERNALYKIDDSDTDARIDEKQRRAQIALKQSLKQEAIDEARRKYDYDDPDFNGWNNYIIKRHPLKKWYTKEYKELVEKPNNAEALEFYNFIRELNKEAKDINYITAVVEKVFMPFVRKDLGENFKLDAGLSAVKNFFAKLQARADDVGVGKINEITGALEDALPKYYTYDFIRQSDGTKDYTDVSQEVFKNTILYIQSLERYKYMSEIEDQLLLVKSMEETKKHLETSQLGDVTFENENPLIRKGNRENAELFSVFLKSVFYGQKFPLTNSDVKIPTDKIGEFFKSAWFAALGKDYVSEEKKGPSTYTSAVKGADLLNKVTSWTLLGLDITSGLANLFGTNLQLMAQKSDYFNYGEILNNARSLWNHLFTEGKSDKVFFSLMEAFMPLSEDPSYEYYKEAGLTTFTRASLGDIIMVFMRRPELLMEKAIFKTLLQNTMVENGKLVNIQQFVKQKYKAKMYSEVGGVKKYKELVDKEIKELKKRSIENIAKLDENGNLVVEGLDLNNKKEVKRLTLLTRRISNRATGKLSATNKSQAELHILGSMFLLLKRWAAPLLFTRFETIHRLNDDFSVTVKDGEVVGERYDIGRTRLYIYLLSTSIRERSRNIINILRGTEKGLQKLDELYKTYQEDYKKMTGRNLKMTPEDFKDMVYTNLRNQTKELRLLLLMFMLVLAYGGAAPDDKEGRAAKNRFRYAEKILHKFYDELSFFYRPGEIFGLFSSGMASASFIENFLLFLGHLTEELTGIDISDPSKPTEQVIKEAKPLKYAIKMVPGGRSIMNWLASFNDQFAKDFDITIQKGNRR